MVANTKVDEADLSARAPEDVPATVNAVPPVRAQDDEREERAGIYLVALFALALPILIALAVVLPGGSSTDSTGEAPNSTGLDRVEVGSVETTGELEVEDDVDVEVEGVAQRNGEEAGSAAPVDVEIGSAEQLSAESSDSEVEVDASAEANLASSAADAASDSAPSIDARSDASASQANVIAGSDESPTDQSEPSTTGSEDELVSAPAVLTSNDTQTETSPASTTTAPATTTTTEVVDLSLIHI